MKQKMYTVWEPQWKQQGIHTSTAHVVQTLNFNDNVRHKCLLQKNWNYPWQKRR